LEAHTATRAGRRVVALVSSPVHLGWSGRQTGRRPQPTHEPPLPSLPLPRRLPWRPGGLSFTPHSRRIRKRAVGGAWVERALFHLISVRGKTAFVRGKRRSVGKLRSATAIRIFLTFPSGYSYVRWPICFLAASPARPRGA